MSTKDLLHYFDGYGPSWVEWINDSSCNVVFEDHASVQRVLLMLAIPPNNDESLIEKNLLVRLLRVLDYTWCSCGERPCRL